MIELLSEHQNAVQALCVRYGVLRFELFGSAANGEYKDGTSDLDFLVQFGPCSPGEHYERYFGLLEALEALFNRKVDLVETGAIRNPYFLRRVEESRTLLYAA